MKQLRALLLRLSGLFPNELQEREHAEEIESHLQMHVEDNLRCGMTPEQARRDAILKLGGVESTMQAYREAGSIPFLEKLLQDIRFAIRQVAKHPGFALIATLILALGIGASTAIFSAVNPILFQPLPYLHADNIVMVWEMRRGGSPLQVTFGTFRGLAESSCTPWPRCTRKATTAQVAPPTA
jgi:macrolide transport system ATP-binding/permease protein